MPPRIALVLLLMAVFCGVAGEPKPDAADSTAAKLEYRIIPVPESVFTTVDTSSKTGQRKPKAGIRQIREADTLQYDVTEFLKPYGVSFPEGSLAIYTRGDLILRNTAANLVLISHIMPDQQSEINSSSISVDVSAYECALAPAKGLLPWTTLTFNDLQNLPRGSVKLIDRISVAALSMGRTTASHVTNLGVPEKTSGNAVENQGGDFTFQRGDTGSELEIEPDYNELTLRYLLRAKLEGGGNEIAKLNLTTSFILWEDYPAVIHAAQVEDQPGKYIVVVAQIDFDGLSRWKLPPPKSSPAPVSPAAQPAASAKSLIPPGMKLEIVRVPPGLLSPVVTGNQSKIPDVQDLLKNNGVEFPPGSTAFFDKQPTGGTVIVINTPQNIELADMVLSSGIGQGGNRLVSVELSAYEFAFPAGMVIHNMDKFTFSDLEGLQQQKLVKPLGCISLVTKSGNPASAMKVTGPFPDDESQYMTLADIWKFHPNESGIKLEAQPSVNDMQRDNIGLDITYTLRIPPEKNGGEPSVFKSAASIAVVNGSPLVVRIVPSKDHEGKYIAIVARAARVNSGGWEVPDTK